MDVFSLRITIINKLSQRIIFTALLFSTAISLLLIDSARAELPEFENVRVLESPRDISVEGLADQNDEPFDFDQLRGQVVLVIFGFTNCADVCPMALHRLRQLEAAHDIHMDDVTYVMVSVDGQRDSARVMRDYLSRFSSRFVGVTGSADAIRATAVQFSAAYFKGISSSGDEHYAVSHSQQIFVVDRAGQLRGEFHGASIETMLAVTTALTDEQQELSAGLRQ
jgi:cytochrome oxidase Cu insertion factor (SCO1/SenC/PrrC family)